VFAFVGFILISTKLTLSRPKTALFKDTVRTAQ